MELSLDGKLLGLTDGSELSIIYGNALRVDNMLLLGLTDTSSPVGALVPVRALLLGSTRLGCLLLHFLHTVTKLVLLASIEELIPGKLSWISYSCEFIRDLE